ncbi:phospholipase A [Rhodocyclus tenuis]|uniref:Phospholipase A1 n=1 Tax=Rhodocyclus tenuis TaxID=1066 RepID=A0A840G3G9_RHOTE|nr:phospholipase A [Rhodocyclus tenuis]MBB4246943.1 phospholipase A1 [Rhodocyclus tenuis]
MQQKRGSVLLGLGCLLAMPLAEAASLQSCAAISENAQRLRCFDELARDQGPLLAANTAALQPAAVAAPAPQAAPAASESAPVSPLAERWEVNAESKRGVWSFRPHKTNYLLFGRYSDRVNERPFSPYLHANVAEAQGLDATEAKFQLSFKTKVHQDLLGSGADLWFGYTQQNNWQLYNKGISAPFRETDYEPELFVTVPTDYKLLGLRGRFLNVGFVHQSNGQSRPLSRSWNRIYAQAGFEIGDDFSLLLKPWYRIKESADSDDNPGINRYVGDFEAEASYRFGAQRLTLIGRSTWDAKRGFAQLDWTFPLLEKQKLKGYVQFTTGYGESLIDYNHRQNTIGFGVLLTDWM